MRMLRKATKIFKRLAQHRTCSGAGFGLVEVIIAVTITVSFIAVVTKINAFYASLASRQSSMVQGAFLAEEGVEAVRFMRDQSWSANIAPLLAETDYYVFFTGVAWATSTTPFGGEFERKIKFSEVYRDANGDITDGPGVLDPRTKLVTSIVSWQNHELVSSETFSAYIADLFEN